MADDIADNKSLSSIKKMKILKFFDKSIQHEKKSKIKVLDNLIDLFSEIPFGKKYSRLLLKAFILDASDKKYKNWNDLIYYCQNSANPVGRFVIDLMYLKEKRDKLNLHLIYQASDNLCTSLQILNHIQDCKDDYMNLRRVYIPGNLMKKYSVSQKVFSTNNSNNQFSKVIEEIIDKIEVMLENSVEGLKLISSRRLRIETLIILNIAKRLSNLLKIKDPLKKKVKLSRIDLIFCFIKGIIS
jgi:phytoene/squalene synthetase